MSSQAYVGTAKRTFKQAIVHLLQSEYSILGSDRITQLLAGDIEPRCRRAARPPRRSPEDSS